MMNKKVIIGILVVIAIICIIVGIKLFSVSKINPIIFQMGLNEDYTYIIYEDKEYVPYCAISNNDRGEYLGYTENDEQEEIYTYKTYPKEEWLISFIKVGLGGESMLYKEKNVTNIPEGLYSEYEWNNINSNIENDLEFKDYGVVTNIEDNTITIRNEDLHQIEIQKDTKITNYRTMEEMDISDIKIGDYYKSGEVIRNVSGEEWEKECIKNLAYCYAPGRNLICNPREITNVENRGDYVIVTLIMEDSTKMYFSEQDNTNTFELKAIAHSNLDIPTVTEGVTVYNLKEETDGFMFWIGLDENTINDEYPTISDIEIYDK